MSLAPREIAFGVALIVIAAALTAILIVLLQPTLRRNALSRPNARSSHKTPTPQGGGIAVIAATVGVTAVACLVLDRQTSDPASLALLLGATLLIASVGAIDDFRSIGVAPRLMLQAIAVALVVAALPADLQILPPLPRSIEWALILVGGLWFVNLVNFMDGVDWMTIAEAVPLTACLAVLGTAGALPVHATIVALALGGALLGFAPFNRPVARLFLGDVGSLPIGLLLGWLLILLAGNGHLVAALLLPLYYLADATITLGRRVINREPFLQAHRSHFYQQAVDHKFTVPQVVARVFTVNLALAALALATVLYPMPAITWGALACGTVLVAWLLSSFARSTR